MRNFNNLEETNELVDRLNLIIEKENITIIGIIHENPDGNNESSWTYRIRIG